MVDAVGSVLSGLAAASRRLEVSANNVANQQSTATQVNGVTTNKPFIPKDVVQISLGSGGVRTEIRDIDNATVRRQDPDSPQADTEGFVEFPDVDIAKELVDQQIASYDFKANLKSIQVADRLQQNLLDILS
ncbi:MAG: flagellar basal body rod C-terminal domain-containing protein [Rickettsiales bacterium]